LLFLFLKPHHRILSSKTPSMVLLSNIAHFTIQIFFRVRPKNISHLLEYYYQAFKYPSTLNLPTLKLSTEDNSNVLHPKSINAA
jgi:hypothetical protein